MFSALLKWPLSESPNCSIFMLSKGILWSDDGILAFAPEGKATFGR